MFPNARASVTLDKLIPEAPKEGTCEYRLLAWSLSSPLDSSEKGFKLSSSRFFGFPTGIAETLG